MFIVFLLFVDGKKERWKSYLLGKVRLMIFFLLLLFVAVEFLFKKSVYSALYSLVVVGKSAARKKTISYSKQKMYILIANVFQESKMFHQSMFFYSKLYV